MGKKKKNVVWIVLAVASVIAVAIIALLLMLMKKEDEYRVLKVESLEGTVELKRNDGGEDVFEGMNLKPKDVVTTGKESMIGILADSDKHIVAEENTCFFIESSGDEKKGSLLITLEYGTALYTIENKLNKDSSFDVNTPNAAMSVRGTTFKVCYDKDKNETTLDVTQGSVEVKTPTETKLVGAGNSINIIGSEGKIVETNKSETDTTLDNENEKKDETLPEDESVADDDSNGKIVFKADEGREYEDLFSYNYDSDNDVYIVNGYSEYGYNKLSSYASNSTVEVTFPKAYKGKDVVGIEVVESSDNFSKSLKETNMPKQEWVLTDSYKYCKGFSNSNTFDANNPCTKLVAIKFNEGLESIANGAFSDFTALEMISIPSTLIKLGGRSFMGCTKLSNVTIADGCRAYIEDNTFADTNISSITLPSSMSIIHAGAFNDWNNSGIVIEKIIWNKNHTDTSINGVGDGLYNVCIFYIDGMYFGAGKSAVKAISSTEDGITAFITADIPDNAFLGTGESGAYKNLIVDEGVTSIGINAFCNVSIPNIDLPSTVTTVGSRAFKNAKITKLDLRNVTTAGELILHGATVDTIVINSLAFSSEALSCVSVKDLYINYTGGSLAKSSTNELNLDILEHIYFSGTEEEWVTFIGTETGNNLTVSMDNVTFNATMPE